MKRKHIHHRTFDKLKCAISIICLAMVLVLVLVGQGQVLVLVLGGQVLVLVLGGRVLVLVLVLGGQVLVNIPSNKYDQQSVHATSGQHCIRPIVLEFSTFGTYWCTYNLSI